jgi:hypothetical protein
MMFTYESKDNYDTRHGSPFDRGSADSHYGRSRNPHYFPDGTYQGERVGKDAMTPAQVQAYLAGYQWNEQFGDKKEWA